MTTTTSYLPDATDFTDIPVQPKPGEDAVLCPKCKGHGYWNLKLHAFAPLPGDPHSRRQHFKASCAQCWGWGWVRATSRDAICLHDFVEIKPDQPFRGFHTLKCQVCGKKRSYSTDD